MYPKEEAIFYHSELKPIRTKLDIIRTATITSAAIDIMLALKGARCIRCQSLVPFEEEEGTMLPNELPREARSKERQ